STRRKTLDAIAQLGQCHDADEDSIFVRFPKPCDDTGIRFWPGPFRNDVGIQQEAHRSTLRGRSLARLTFNPEPRSGDAAKNSARLPVRLVFRSHSSAATTTTAVRPCRVMVCGPSACAFSTTSLNFALASARVQVSALITVVQI